MFSIVPQTSGQLSGTCAGKLEVFSPVHEAQWLEVTSQAEQHDFYHLPQYHQLATERGEGDACLFTYREAGHMIALPLLIRPLEASLGGEWYDATSVYGYAGPIASGKSLPGQSICRFQNALRSELDRRRIVTVFTRLHPLLLQEEILGGLGECKAQGQTVAIDLEISPEEQRAQFRKNCRARIDGLGRKGVTCTHDPDLRRLDEFIAVYRETMQRVGAEESYFFEPAYFYRLAECLGSKLHLFAVILDGRVAAAGLFTICDGIVQYHLGGTRTDYLSVAPTGLIFDTVRLWAYEQRAQAIHLGGGVGSSKDSLFHFKAGFSHRRHCFKTWRWVVLPEVYTELCRRREVSVRHDGLEPVSAQYFPSYRSPLKAAGEGSL